MLFVAPSLKNTPSGVLSVACSHAQPADKAPGTLLGSSAPAALAAATVTVAQRRHHQRRKKNTAVKAAAEAAVKEELPLPPGKPGNAMMDLFKYIKDPDEYMAEQVRLYGPIFLTNLFGRKTVVVGGPELVEEFVVAEKKITKSALPDTFSQLHTEYGTMNQAGPKHMNTRGNLIKGALCEEAFQAFLPTIRQRCAELVSDVSKRKRMKVAKELKDWSVKLFSELFAGEAFDDDAVKLLYQYNDGLFALLPFKLPFLAFGRGFKAKDALVKMVKDRLEELKANGDIEKPQYAAMRRLSQSKDENGEDVSTESVAHSVVISVWGAYVELASLLANSIYLLSSHEAVREKAFAAVQEVGSEAEKSEYLQAILDETLRMKPPAGGGFRMAEEELSIGGYRIPKGYVVSADPRVSNADPKLHAKPETFNPERFIERPTRQMPNGSWFPGGIGLHGCPGIPFAMLISKVFLAAWLEKFEDWKPRKGSKEGWVPIPIRIIGDKYEVEVTQR